MKTRVLVGMSGGVDSSVAAALLVKEGYDVIGLTMKTWTDDCSSMHQEKCCGPKAVTDVRAVADQLGIPCYVMAHEEEFKRSVIDYFVDEYTRGRTPNPCVVCNDKLKFGTVLAKAKELGAQYIATGHYARVDHSAESEDGRTLLLKGKDSTKDQSYFLFNLKQDQLRATLFPVGSYTKEQTRAIAKDLGLRTHDKPDSQEICFVPDNRYAHFLRQQAGVAAHAGVVVDTSGKSLGQHEGIEIYTVGQRKGLRIAGKSPYYVTALDAGTNTVTVGEDRDLYCDGLIANRPNWIAMEDLSGPVECQVKIRYNASPVPAIVSPCHCEEANSRRSNLDVPTGLLRCARNDSLAKTDFAVHVVFQDPQRAVSPGQAAVFYRGEMVLGGAWIMEGRMRE